MPGFNVRANNGFTFNGNQTGYGYDSGYRNFAQVDEKLQGRNKQSRKLANNTYLERRGEDAIAVRLHQTDVVNFYRDGRVVLNSGGWQTMTTRDRLNNFSPLRVWQDKGVWYVSDGVTALTYRDDISTNTKGLFDPKLAKTSEKDAAEHRKLRACIVKFAKAFMVEFVAGRIEKPNGGDCWYCSMFQQVGSTDHLLSHIGWTKNEDGEAEVYFVPSMLLNACNENKASLSRAAQGAVYNWLNEIQEKNWTTEFAHTQIGKALKNYLLKNLGLPTR